VHVYLNVFVFMYEFIFVCVCMCVCVCVCVCVELSSIKDLQLAVYRVWCSCGVRVCSYGVHMVSTKDNKRHQNIPSGSTVVA
jgi:hypothetical protein